tara:strand:+ start:52 stop:291 length:240 start_codon:yes stop_codon:yes gene_type:complete
MTKKFKLYFNKSTVEGYKNLADVFSNLKNDSDKKVIFTDKDYKKLNLQSIQMLLQLDEKKIENHFKKIFKMAKSKTASI